MTSSHPRGPAPQYHRLWVRISAYRSGWTKTGAAIWGWVIHLLLSSDQRLSVPSLKRELCDISTFLGLCFHSLSGVASACVRARSLQSCLSVTLWTVAFQAPLSAASSRQEYWSRLSFPLPGNLHNSGIKPVSLYVSCIGRQVLYH